MADLRAPGVPSGAAARFSVPDPAGLVAEFLGSVAAQFLERSASDARKADVLGELLSALRLHDDLARGRYPRRGAVPPRSAALAGIEALVAGAVRYHRGRAAAASATVLPAGLAVPVGDVGGDRKPGALSVVDEMTVAEAALLLGVCTQSVRVLIHSGQIDGWQESEGRRAWHVSRASALAWRERRDGGHGPGGNSARRSA